MWRTDKLSSTNLRLFQTEFFSQNEILFITVWMCCSWKLISNSHFVLDVKLPFLRKVIHKCIYLNYISYYVDLESMCASPGLDEITLWWAFPLISPSSLWAGIQLNYSVNGSSFFMHLITKLVFEYMSKFFRDVDEVDQQMERNISCLWLTHWNMVSALEGSFW